MKYVFDLLRYRRYNYGRVWFEDILLFVFIGKHFVIVIWKPDILCVGGNKMKDLLGMGFFIQQSSRRKGAVSNKHPVSWYASSGRGNAFRIVTDNILNATCGFMENLL